MESEKADKEGERGKARATQAYSRRKDLATGKAVGKQTIM